jgi:hypothetical protein
LKTYEKSKPSVVVKSSLLRAFSLAEGAELEAFDFVPAFSEAEGLVTGGVGSVGESFYGESIAPANEALIAPFIKGNKSG